MPLRSTSSIDSRSENDESINNVVKNEDSSSKADIGANIVLIGAPGSGKGTQSTRLADRYQICHVSTGDLLRQAAQDRTSVEGEKIRQTIEAGRLVEDDIVLSLIDKNLTKPECRNGVLFDGFPRTINQGEQLEQLLQSKQKQIDAVLEYAIDDDLLKRRILGRLVHKPSGRTYHEEFHPPKESMKDDMTGEALERRSDDTEETLSARLNTYHRQTTPLIDFYRQRNLHRSIDATQKVNEVSRQSIELVDQLRQPSTASSRSVEPNLGKNQYEEAVTSKIKSLTSPLDADATRRSNNFLFIYNSMFTKIWLTFLLFARMRTNPMSFTNCLSSSEQVLFDFTNSASSVNDWVEVSDTEREVGMSKGALIEQRTQQFQRAIFFSLLNPQPNGAGFAGVVYRKKTFDLSASSGLKLAVRAQGENFIYKVILRHHHEELSTLPSYEIFFELPKNTITQQYLAFTDFKPYSRGKPLDPDTTPPLDLTDVTSIALQIVGGVYSSVKQHGASSLEIDSISAVKSE